MRFSYPILIFVVVIGLAWEEPAFAEKSKLGNGKYFFHASGNYLFAKSAADTVAGASYTENFSRPLVGGGGVGLLLWKAIYVGARYEYWFGRRTFSLSGTTQIDELNYQTLGAELGYYVSNPRVFWLLMAGVHYPVLLKVITSVGAFTSSQAPLAFIGRLTMGIRFSKYHSLLIEGGYRSANLKELTAGSRSYLSGSNFDLSSPFIGIGLWVHF